MLVDSDLFNIEDCVLQEYNNEQLYFEILPLVELFSIYNNIYMNIVIRTVGTIKLTRKHYNQLNLEVITPQIL